MVGQNSKYLNSIIWWPIDDISDVPRVFGKKDEPLFFRTLISSVNVFPIVITRRDVFPTVINGRKECVSDSYN